MLYNITQNDFQFPLSWLWHLLSASQSAHDLITALVSLRLHCAGLYRAWTILVSGLWKARCQQNQPQLASVQSSWAAPSAAGQRTAAAPAEPGPQHR